MQHRHPLHACAIRAYKNGVDASTVSLINLKGTLEQILTYASYNSEKSIPNWKLVEFHSKPICTAIMALYAI